MAQEPAAARLEARISQEGLTLVRQAAALHGQSLGEFVVAAVQEAAHRTIDETRLIRLSAAEQERFVSVLLDVQPLSPAMERAQAAHDRLIRKP